ncbi:MAG: hypothetical protein LBQ83_03540 [Candidatus Margulisbacteria bacterium]|jgi:hypothetical protein|nr:hypothetical protein [Candidatus Margulisiibacteriota bacterium]
MQETTKVLTEQNTEYSVNPEVQGESFFSADIESGGLGLTGDTVSFHSSTLPPPKLAKSKRAKDRGNAAAQPFLAGFMQRLFIRSKKTKAAKPDKAALTGGFRKKEQFPAAKTADTSYLRNLKGYDPAEQIKQDRDSYYTVEQRGGKTAVNNAYGYSELTGGYNSVDTYIEPDNPAILRLLDSIPGLNDTALSTEEKLLKLYNYIIANFTYIPDARDDWGFVDETIARRGGDCEDLATLLASAMLALLLREGLDAETARSRVLAVAGQDALYGDHVFVEYLADDGNWYVFDAAMADKKTAGSLSELKQTKELDFRIYFRFNDKAISGETLDSADISAQAIAFRAAANARPVANAGNDQTITLPTSSVTLNGSGSDTDGSITAYKWSKLQGPGSPVISNSTSASATVTGLQEGTYVFLLTVTDNAGAAHSDYVTITVNPAPPNKSPTANAGNDQTITLPANSVTLSGSGSDPDGSIASYKWSKYSGPGSPVISNSTSASATVTGLQEGTYVFLLTVTDNAGAAHSDYVTITVNPAPPNKSPTANAGNDQTITLPANSVTLSGSGSDPDGSIASYAWSKYSGPGSPVISNSTSASTTVTGLQEGTYVFLLTVTDNKGATHSDYVTVTVNPVPPPPANRRPTANAGGDQTITMPDNSVTLSGSGSDPDGTIASYAWSKHSGPGSPVISNSASASTTVTGLQEGTYVFLLTVTDNKGATHSDYVTITVLPEPPPPNMPPAANAGNDQTITLPADSVTLSGSGSDPDGSIASYAWSKYSGPGSPVISNSASASTTVTGLQEGTYVFLLTVTDDKGATHSDYVTITVLPEPPNIRPTANAGGDVYLTLPNNQAYLNGSNSYDADGEIIAYQWSKISGPDTYTLTGADTDFATVSDLQEGVYVFLLTVTDDKGATHSDYVTITVSHTPQEPINPNKVEGTHVPIESLGTIISQEVTDALIALSYDENFFEVFYAYGISDGMRAGMFLSDDIQAELERLVTAGDKDALNAYILKEVLPWLRKQYEQYDELAHQSNQYYNNCRRIQNTIDELNKWLQAQDMNTVIKRAFKKIKTPFLIMRSDKLEELKDKILTKANLQKLLTMLTQAKGDSYNAVLQILTQQSGYQKMNIEKLNDRQIESLTNYVNTRTKEIADFVNNYNTTEENKIKQAQAEQRRQENANLFLRLVAGIISALISIVAAIFSAGIATPIVVSIIAACVDIVATARQTQSDIEIKKAQEEIEEMLALLRTAEKKLETDYLQKKKEELEKLRSETDASSEYAKLLDLEIMQLNAVRASSALTPDSGYLRFDNAQHLQNSLRVQALINLLRIYSLLKKEEHESRSRVAAELSLPAAAAPVSGEQVVNSKATVLLEKMNKLGELEIKVAEAYNRRKAVSEEIKQSRLRTGFDILGKVVFTLVNLVTFGSGGTALAGMLSGAGEAAYNMFSKYLLLLKTSYNPGKPADFRAPAKKADRPGQEDFNSIYAELLSNSSELSRDLTAQKKTLDYDQYLRLLKDIELQQLKENLLISLNAAEKNSRSIVHQEMTDSKGRTQNTFVKIAAQQNIALLQDVVKKQAYLTQLRNQTINQQVDQRTEIANAGFNILASAATGFLSGQARLAGADKKTTDAFLYGLGSGLLGNSQQDIFDLIISDSALKFKTEDQQYSSSNFLSSGSFENMLADDQQGNYTVEQNTLLRNYAKLQRQILLEQALTSVQTAKQKAREIIHMEIAEKSAPASELTKTFADIRQESVMNRWNVFVEQAYAAAEQLTQKNTRWTELQRNFLINLTSASFSAAAFAGGLEQEQAASIQKLTYLSLQLIAQAYALQDTTLDLANRVQAGHFTSGELAETLGLNRLSGAEQKLLTEALELKTNSGLYGFQAENKGYLEYLNVLLERLQKIKEIILQINTAIQSSRSNVHAVLSAAAAEIESLLDDWNKQNSGFLRQIMQSIKKGDSEIIKRRNQRNTKKFEMYMGLFSGASTAFSSLVPFMQEGTARETLDILAQDLQSFLPLLQSGLLYINRGSQTSAELPELSGLTRSEQAQVLSAASEADLALAEAPQELWQKNIELAEQGIRSLSKLAARKAVAAIMDQRLEQLLLDSRLVEARQQAAELAEKQDEQRRNIAGLFSGLAGSNYYASHILPALELHQAGRAAEALTSLNEKCTENFLTGVELPEQEVAGIRALQSGLKELQQTAAGLAAAQTALTALESGAQAELEKFREGLAYLQAHSAGFNAASQKYTAALQNVGQYKEEFSRLFADSNSYHLNIHRYVLASDSAAQELEARVSPAAAACLRDLREYSQAYRQMLQALRPVAPLFTDEARYKTLLEGLAPTASFYGGEVDRVLNVLLSAQRLYGSFIDNYNLLKPYSAAYIELAPFFETELLAAAAETEKPAMLAEYAVAAAIYQKLDYPVLEPGKGTRHSEIATQATSIYTNHRYREPGGDLSELWAQYFQEQGDRGKNDGLRQKQISAARTNRENAQKDLANAAALFERHKGLQEEIDISTADLTPEAKNYILQLCGNGKIFNENLRATILDYLERRKDNREIALLNEEADVDFARTIIDTDWLDIQKLQSEYTELVRQYAGTGNNAVTDAELAELKKRKDELEARERSFRQKRERFLTRRGRN